MRPSVGTAGVALALYLIVASCSVALGADWTFEIRVVDALARLNADAVEEGALLNRIARSITDELKLPLPEGVPFAAYGSEEAFVGALIRQGLSAEFARQAGRSSLAVTFRGTIFVRADFLSSKPIAERAAIYGHELAHVAQRHFGGDKKDVPAWMREGYSEWVGRRVVGLLGLKAYAQSRREIRRSVSVTARHAPLPPLSLLDTRGGWRDSVREYGPTLYDQAFLAIDWLVERYGEAQLREYLRSERRSHTPPLPTSPFLGTGAWRSRSPTTTSSWSSVDTSPGRRDPYLRHDVLGPAFEERDDVARDARVEEIHALGGLIGVVRSQDDLRASEDRVIGRGWLGVEDVERGTVDRGPRLATRAS